MNSTFDILPVDFLADWPWLAWFFRRLQSFVDVSFFDGGGRYYWVSGLTSLGVLAIAYTLRPDWRARWGGGFLRFCFPAGFFTHRSTVTDIQLNLVNYFISPGINIMWRFTGVFFTIYLMTVMVAVFGPPPQSLEWAWWTILGYTVVHAVLSDFGYWVWHYLAHTVPALWAFHKVHHSAEVLTPLVAGRVHPVETILLPVFRNAAVSLVMAPALYFFVGTAPAMTLLGMELVGALFAIAGDQLFHAHVPISWGDRLNRVFVSPATHQIHHSVARQHWDKNMGGYLAVWDWMFGTLVLPDSHQDIRYGVRDDMPQPHPGLIAAYLQPFADLWRDLPRPARLFWRHEE